MAATFMTRMTNADTAHTSSESGIEPIDADNAGSETLQMNDAELRAMLAANNATTRHDVVATVQLSARLVRLQAAQGQAMALQETILTARISGQEDLLSLCKEISSLELNPQMRNQCLRLALARPEAERISTELAVEFLRVTGIDQGLVLNKLEARQIPKEDHIVAMMVALKNPNLTNLLFRKFHYQVGFGEKPSADGMLTPEAAIKGLKDHPHIQAYAMILQIKTPREPHERGRWFFPLMSALGDVEAGAELIKRFDATFKFVAPRPEPKRPR